MTPPAPTPGNTCKPGQLAIEGVRGGAYQGREIAGVLFTNTSATPCTMSGYPSARLIRNGRPIGRPADDEPGTVKPVLLANGQTAQTELTAVTTCQAPISDAVRIALPNWAHPVDAQVQLRACSLSVSPISRS